MSAWDGNGGWSWSYTWTTEAALGNPISAAKMDAQFADATAGFRNCLTRDGQGKPSANLDMNGFKWTNAANGSAATDLATYGQLTGLTTGNAFRKNLLKNGNFQVWQAWDGGSALALGAATRLRAADCWWMIRQGTTGYTCTQSPGEFGTYALKWQRDSANASTQNMLLAQSLETVDCLWMKRSVQTLVLSFYAKKGANYSGGNLTIDVVRGTGSNQNVLDGYTGASTLATLSQALTTTLTRYSLVVPTDTSTNELGVRFTWTPTGVAGADDSVTLECVQLEKASAATEYEFVSFAETLNLCQRYYEKSFPYVIKPASNLATINVDGASWHCLSAGAVTSPLFWVPFKVAKRTANLPGTEYTVTTYNPGAVSAEIRNITDGANCTSVAASCSQNGILLSCTQNAGAALGERLYTDWSVSDNTF